MVAVVRQRLPHAPRSTHYVAVYSENLDAAKGRGTGGGQENYRLRAVYLAIAGRASSLRHLEAATQLRRGGTTLPDAPIGIPLLHMTAKRSLGLKRWQSGTPSARGPNQKFRDSCGLRRYRSYLQLGRRLNPMTLRPPL